MPLLTVIVGLPGSGKSRRVAQIRREGSIRAEDVFDDYYAKAAGHEPHLSVFFDSLTLALQANRPCLLVDIAFCNKAYLDAILTVIKDKVPAAQLEVLYFANSPAACIRNLAHDESGRTDLLERVRNVLRFSPHYRPPMNAIAVHEVQCQPRS